MWYILFVLNKVFLYQTILKKLINLLLFFLNLYSSRYRSSALTSTLIFFYIHLGFFMCNIVVWIRMCGIRYILNILLLSWYYVFWFIPFLNFLDIVQRIIYISFSWASRNLILIVHTFSWLRYISLVTFWYTIFYKKSILLLIELCLFFVITLYRVFHLFFQICLNC